MDYGKSHLTVDAEPVMFTVVLISVWAGQVFHHEEKLLKQLRPPHHSTIVLQLQKETERQGTHVAKGVKIMMPSRSKYHHYSVV